jgi:polyhydroxyalkanoate synthase
VPADEDRHLAWDDVLDRLRRALRAVRRAAACDRVGLLGYCMGATLCGIHAAREQSGQCRGPREGLTGFVNLLGPFDFSRAGALVSLTDARWFDADAIAAAGNVAPDQMQAGFTAMRPTLALAKWVGFLDRREQPGAVAAFNALETWASDNVPFPGAAYATYVRELYQRNALVRGEHAIADLRVDLQRITCPVLTVCAARDTICPPDAATALNDCCGAQERQVLQVPGGHVGAVIGARAARDLYPAIAAFFLRHAGVNAMAPASGAGATDAVRTSPA